MSVALFSKIHNYLGHWIFSKILFDAFSHRGSDMTISYVSYQCHYHKHSLATKGICYLVGPSCLMVKLNIELC